ncbi:PBSX family phage terminase large subunit [Gordonia bronchialis]|uniref:PBSX family phage terminase large subunit n=1 Tax=Gordonia bronchialis TaxID=2054 RepID=UPI001CC1ABB7|nr:PBSX family phage terminase large subunit [Gordonia bronchialis]UAK38436.1 PBSX family phage terminase large subunit [Gordonia bronchialis]
MTAPAMSPKQIRSIAEADTRVSLWSGAVRSGKTISSILRWFMFLASPPKQGGHFVMVGRTRDSIARNVIDVMQNEQLFGKLAGEVTYRTGQPFATILGRKVWVLGAHDNQAEKTLRGLTVAGAYVDEATVIQQDFFKQLLARMSVDGAQLFATTNPDNPMHWLKSEFIDRIGTGPGQLKDWRTWHFTLDDNPRLSEAYKDSLKAEYTGLWYRRFIQGEWVSAEGAVFDMWDPARHIVAWEKLPRMEELVCMGVDYGTTNPTVAVILGRGEDNVMYVVDEWSHEAKESEQRWTDAELSKAIRRFHRSRHLPEYGDKFERTEDPVEITVVDPAAASLRVQLQQDGMHSYTANNDLGYGVPLLGSLFSRGRLKISSRCVRLAREIPGYSWDPKATEKGQDIPIKANDHCLVAETPVTTDRGEVPIVDVVVGDRVLTRGGWRRVMKSGMTFAEAEVLTVTASDGRVIIGTGDHPVWVEGRGFVRLDALRYGDILDTGSAPTPVSRPTAEQRVSTTSTGCAPCANEPSASIGTARPRPAPVHVVSVRAELDRRPVYDLTVDEHHEFYANGILVHNSIDATRYALVSTEGRWRPAIDRAAIDISKQPA